MSISNSIQACAWNIQTDLIFSNIDNDHYEFATIRKVTNPLLQRRSIYICVYVYSLMILSFQFMTTTGLLLKSNLQNVF